MTEQRLNAHRSSGESNMVESCHKVPLKTPAAPPLSQFSESTQILHSVHVLNRRKKTRLLVYRKPDSAASVVPTRVQTQQLLEPSQTERVWSRRRSQKPETVNRHPG